MYKYFCGWDYPRKIFHGMLTLLFIVKYISCFLFSWFTQTTKIFLQRKFPDLRYPNVCVLKSLWPCSWNAWLTTTQRSCVDWQHAHFSQSIIRGWLLLLLIACTVAIDLVCMRNFYPQMCHWSFWTTAGHVCQCPAWHHWSHAHWIRRVSLFCLDH